MRSEVLTIPTVQSEQPQLVDCWGFVLSLGGPDVFPVVARVEYADGAHETLRVREGVMYSSGRRMVRVWLTSPVGGAVLVDSSRHVADLIVPSPAASSGLLAESWVTLPVVLGQDLQPVLPAGPWKRPEGATNLSVEWLATVSLTNAAPLDRVRWHDEDGAVRYERVATGFPANWPIQVVTFHGRAAGAPTPGDMNACIAFPCAPPPYVSLGWKAVAANAAGTIRWRIAWWA